MFNLTILEVFFRAIPEAMIFMMGMYLFSKTPLEKKEFFQLSAVQFLGIVLIRKLPISYGIHTILIIIVGIFLGTVYMKVEIIKSIRAAVLIILMQSVSEGVNVVWIQCGLGKDIETIFANETNKILYGIPSLVFTATILWMIYIKQYKVKSSEKGSVGA